jgi:hypothetical protein
LTVTNAAPYRTHSGVMLDLTDPRPEQICLEDVAHHLARVCRFGGAVDGYYSVASHSVYVSRNLPSAYARAGLLHDATEAFLGDVVSGLKRLLPTYRDLEDVWAGCIEARFDVRFRRCPVVKDGDLRARLSECRDLFVGYPRELLLGGEGDRQPYAEVCRVLPPDEAEWEFLAEAQRLGIE